MRRFLLVLLVLLLFGLPGCGKEQDRSNTPETIYHSDTSSQDCYLCGGGIEDLAPFYWGQNNLALVSLNTFDIKPIEINRYNRITGQLIEEYAGTVSLGGGESKDGGFSASLLLDYDRGYAVGSVDFYDDMILDADNAASFLCADCLNEILPQDLEQCFGVRVLHLATKEIRVLDEHTSGFTFGDFYVDCNLENSEFHSQWLDIIIFYCPVRYENEVQNTGQTPRAAADLRCEPLTKF